MIFLTFSFNFKNTVYNTTHKICVNRLFILLAGLPVNSRLLVKFLGELIKGQLCLRNYHPDENGEYKALPVFFIEKSFIPFTV